MNFMSEVLEKSKKEWDDCYNSKFVCDVATNQVSEESFKHYIIQDTLYLKEYARVFAIAMSRASSLEEMKIYYTMMSFVNESEGSTRLVYLEKWGMTPEEVEAVEMTKVTKDYCDFMLEIAKKGDQAEILMATLPCTLSYFWLWDKVVKEYPNIKSIKYWDFVADYTTESYGISCEKWCAQVDELCKNETQERKHHLQEIFKIGSIHEVNFWKMANQP